MPEVYVAGYNTQPIIKSSGTSLKKLASRTLLAALRNSQMERCDCLIVSNMLSDELEGQKHLGPLIASQAGLNGIEAWHIRAATAGGSAAIRAAWLALKSQQVETVAVVGIEMMHGGLATPILAKALDLESEIKKDQTMISINALLMKKYLEYYKVPYENFSNFAINAHNNAFDCDYAFLKKKMSLNDVLGSKMISKPIRLSDCSPVCDGAATIILTNNPDLALPENIRLLACEVATDTFEVAKRKNILELRAAALSSKKAFEKSNLSAKDIDFFELHDAFSIMSCLSLEATGFANQGEGWKMALDGDIFRDGSLPISTFGGLKARGHPIGATAIYQACEITSQLSGNSGKNQIKKEAKTAMMQSIGGAGATIITSIFTRT